MRYCIGQRTFMKVDTAAQYAIDNDKDVDDFQILQEGSTRLMDRHERAEFLTFMRHWAV